MDKQSSGQTIFITRNIDHRNYFKTCKKAICTFVNDQDMGSYTCECIEDYVGDGKTCEYIPTCCHNIKLSGSTFSNLNQNYIYKNNANGRAFYDDYAGKYNVHYDGTNWCVGQTSYIATNGYGWGWIHTNQSPMHCVTK